MSSRDDPVPGKESSSALVLELAVLVLSQGNLQHVVKLKQIHSSVFNKFPIQQYYVCRGEQNYSLKILKKQPKLCIVLENEKLAENAPINLFSFFGITTKNINFIALLSSACLR